MPTTAAVGLGVLGAGRLGALVTGRAAGLACGGGFAAAAAEWPAQAVTGARTMAIIAPAAIRAAIMAAEFTRRSLAAGADLSCPGSSAPGASLCRWRSWAGRARTGWSVA